MNSKPNKLRNCRFTEN